MGPKKHVLFVDDDEKYLSHLQSAFSPVYQVSLATTIAQAEETLAKQRTDVIVLDYRLESEDGHEFIDRLQTTKERPPVIVVSGCFDTDMAKGFLKRQIQGFFEKPVSIEELQAAIDKLTPAVASQPDFEVSSDTRMVLYADREVLLTPIEFEILNFFLKRPGQQIARSEIIHHLWGEKSVSRNAFDTHLLNLKKKLPPFAAKLTSVYGAGYYYEV